MGILPLFPPDDMEEGFGEEKDDNNENNEEEKEAEFPKGRKGFNLKKTQRI